jgi:hypothetical protein
MTVQKKQEIKPSVSSEAEIETKEAGIKTEPITTSDTATETVEAAEIETDDKPSSQADALKDFKEKMSEEELFSEDEPRRKNFMWPILSIFIIAIILLIGIFAYRQGMFKVTKVNKVAITTPTPAITAEPTKTVDLKKYEIEILNGSGVAGEASKQKDSLETAGFTISSIGNASNSDYKNTVIKAKTEVDKAFIAKLKSALESAFTVGDAEVLSDDSPVPVVVILGAKK